MKLKDVFSIVLTLTGVSVIVWAGVIIWQEQGQLAATSLKQPSPSLWQPESIIPTVPPAGLEPGSQILDVAATLTPTGPFSESRLAKFLTVAGSDSRAALLPANALKRFGVGVPYPPLETKAVDTLDLGWYLAWRVLETPNQSGGIEFWQMIRVNEQGFTPDKAVIHKVAQANPGAIWLIGNEPDVIWQDNVTPVRYAEWYHELYYFLKEIDPSCQIAIGGVTQPSPLRLQYLERVISAYRTRYGEPMPVDVWNIHNFILREARGEWGVDIPPGFAVNRGILYEVEDHDDLEIFKAQLFNFRQWMADRGQRDKPLIVSEYGILMPAEYGFDSERVKKFMYGTYEFMLTATDDQVGYPVDDNRLVQRWAWYSLSDDNYPSGNLIDFATGELTNLGKAHQEYVINLP